MISKAIEYAATAHNGQLRKGSNIPYISHPITVMYYLIETWNCCDKLLTTAILHDVLENCDVNPKEIEEIFGKEILEGVLHLTEPDKKLSWKERKTHTLNKILNDMPDNILYVACADKLHNLRSMHEDYLKIKNKLWDKFNAPKESQKWYYTSLAEAFEYRAKTLKNKKIFQDFKEEVNVFFNTLIET